MREEIIHEVEKTERNQLVIGKLMNTTYALRRQEIVGALVAPQVRDVVDRWPALLMESQVKKYIYIFYYFTVLPVEQLIIMTLQHAHIEHD